jgi:hypothetical protein
MTKPIEERIRDHICETLGVSNDAVPVQYQRPADGVAPSRVAEDAVSLCDEMARARDMAIANLLAREPSP